MNFQNDVVATGTWEYAASVQKPVFIVRLNYDFWYEIAKEDGHLEPDEQPRLNDEGNIYYVSFHGIHRDGTFWPDSGGNLTIEDAKAAAESKLPSDITWSTP
ncbi:hypothetical protein ACGFNU_20535 [Spirillospora sp. NPDC048911]|uniref:hypothetical protein n=1 Tax=Spirillospora sp. NPDC048911 TaxID=3364527 RepID=UPI0037201368